MIAYVQGKILAHGTNHAIVLVGGTEGGVGYKIFLTQDTLDGINKPDTTTAFNRTDKIALWTYHAIREDAQDLYGFPDQDTLRFFELLIGISGIGPKSALSILNLASVKTLRTAVINGDPDHLTKVSGIGKKNAEKIVLELKNKIVADNDENTAATSEESDALEALKGLGYSERDARDALKKIDKKDSAATIDGRTDGRTPTTGSHNTKTAGEKVKQALKILAR
jgi:Holliday junction DNA helicase RuvA